MRPMRARRASLHPLLRALAALSLLVAAGFVLVRAQESGAPDVKYQDLLDGLKHPTQWLTYSGDYNGQRHSPLKQITPANVHQLSAQWTFQTGHSAASRRRRWSSTA